MKQVERRPEGIPLVTACQILGINRGTLYARHRPPGSNGEAARLPARQPRALDTAERREVLDILHSEEFRDQPPAEVYAALLDRGVYLCSVSTMYRLLRGQGESGERRRQRPAQHHAVPRLCAAAPNQVWTWDITKLPLVKKGEYLCLYVVIDLFSRFVLAWMLSRKENSALSRQLMREAAARYAVAAGELTVHQDRGSPMIARAYLDLMAELGVTCSHSRPRVSNDNPFSESQFKTLKYQPDYPRRFEHITHAQQWCGDYFDWYNHRHYHSGLAGFTPEQVFTGRYIDLAGRRNAALQVHYAGHPERFVKGPPKVELPAQQVTINPLYREDGSWDNEAGVNFPTLGAVKQRMAKTP